MQDDSKYGVCTDNGVFIFKVTHTGELQQLKSFFIYDKVYLKGMNVVSMIVLGRNEFLFSIWRKGLVIMKDEKEVLRHKQR